MEGQSSPNVTGRDDQSVEEEEGRLCYLEEPKDYVPLLAWLSLAMALNILLGLASWWRCYANNFLHWGAMATWLLLVVQGELGMALALL